jgi:hypothetical protein
MKTKIQSPSSGTHLDYLQVLNYQGIQSLVLTIPANPSFRSKESGKFPKS